MKHATSIPSFNCFAPWRNPQSLQCKLVHQTCQPHHKSKYWRLDQIKKLEIECEQDRDEKVSSSSFFCTILPYELLDFGYCSAVGLHTDATGVLSTKLWEGFEARGKNIPQEKSAVHYAQEEVKQFLSLVPTRIFGRERCRGIASKLPAKALTLSQ